MNETGDAARFFPASKMSKNSYRPLQCQVPVFLRPFPAERTSKVGSRLRSVSEKCWGATNIIVIRE